MNKSKRTDPKLSLQKHYSTVTVLSYQIKCQRGSHNGDCGVCRTDTYLTAFEPRSFEKRPPRICGWL